MIGARARDLATLDPIAARSPALVAFFGRIMARTMARRFHAIRMAKTGRPCLVDGRPAVLYANHPSWWDPALFIVLATRLFSARSGFGPIDLEALRRYRFMSRIGLFGVEQGTRRGAARFLHTAERILAQQDAILWITPEGEFTDVRARPVRLRPGLAHLARRCPHAIFVPLALEYPFWTERTPEALCRFGEPLEASAQADLGVHGWSALLGERLTEAMDALAGDAMARDPARFDLVLSGRAGVGGIYDIWRRGRALVKGERFAPEHGSLTRARDTGR